MSDSPPKEGERVLSRRGLVGPSQVIADPRIRCLPRPTRPGIQDAGEGLAFRTCSDVGTIPGIDSTELRPFAEIGDDDRRKGSDELFLKRGKCWCHRGDSLARRDGSSSELST
jgi:hypothetical protein